MTGYDKNTGVELNMPRHANFRMTSDGEKIAYMSIMDDQVLWRKAYDAYETKKNGVIYKDHPYVSKVRLLIQSYETMDPEKIKPHYLPSTRFYDVMNSVPFNKSKSLEEEFKDFSSYAEVLELTDIREYGFPDVLDYEGDGAVVISWWEMDFKNKGLSWREDVEEDLPRIMVDPQRLQQVLINLIGNAVQYTHQGAVSYTHLTLPTIYSV